MKEKRKRGGQKGNQNARTHGFYSKALDDTEKDDMEQASGISDIDDEIALMRVKIKAILEKEPENVKLIMQATSTLAELIIKQCKINKEQRKGLKEAIGSVLKEVGIPLGLSVGADVISKRLG
jgi:hypothetical protein